jgi:NADH:ubiquinone oxidoreductase subunit 6 (subunit J)
LCGAEFVGICYVIIYVGAVAVLFLFVIMILNLRVVEWLTHRLTFLPFGMAPASLICVHFLAEHCLAQKFEFVTCIFSADCVCLSLVCGFSLASSTFFWCIQDGLFLNLRMVVFLRKPFYCLLGVVTLPQRPLRFLSLTHTDNIIDTIGLTSFGVNCAHNGLANVSFLANLLYVPCMPYLLCSGMVLLVAMYGAIFLTIVRTHSTLSQNVFSQLSRNGTGFSYS